MSPAGMCSSAKPARGPQDNRWRSCRATPPASASCQGAHKRVMRALDGELVRGRNEWEPVSLAINAAAASANPGTELMPVPTAVPPSAKRYASVLGRAHRLRGALRFNRDLASASYPRRRPRSRERPTKRMASSFRRPDKRQRPIPEFYGKQATRSRSGRHRRPELI